MPGTGAGEVTGFFLWGWCGHCRQFLELPRGTKQETCWDEGFGFGHSSVLTCSTFTLHALFPFLGALSAMKEDFCFCLHCTTASVLTQGSSTVEMDFRLGFNLLK